MKHIVCGTVFHAYHLFYGFSRLLSQKLGKGCFFFWYVHLYFSNLGKELAQLLVKYLYIYVHLCDELPPNLAAITFKS